MPALPPSASKKATFSARSMREWKRIKLADFRRPLAAALCPQSELDGDRLGILLVKGRGEEHERAGRSVRVGREAKAEFAARVFGQTERGRLQTTPGRPLQLLDTHAPSEVRPLGGQPEGNGRLLDGQLDANSDQQTGGSVESGERPGRHEQRPAERLVLGELERVFCNKE